MNFALEENEPFAAAVRRLAVEQIDLAISQLSAPLANLDKSIHVTRQSLKRIRALLALVRSELGDKVFEREWICYRDVGRRLAGGRDAAVVVGTLDALVRHFSSELEANAFALERRFLVERREAQLRLMIEQEAALEKAAEILTAARARVATWPARQAGYKTIRDGVRRCYRVGRQGLQNVLRHPSPTNFHKWRRPVKLLWHQLQILTPVWPVILNAHAEQLRSLSDRLNDNHDLDLLRTVFPAQVDIQPFGQQPLASLIDRRCRQLEAEGLQLGERLYCERPRGFAARLKGYWQVWERQAASRQPSTAAEESKRQVIAELTAQASR